MHRYYLPNDICIILQFKFKPNDFCEQWTQRLQWMESILSVDALKFCCSLSYKLARSIAIAIFRLPNPYQSLVLLQMKTIYVDFGQQFYYFCLVFLTNVYAKYWNRFVGTTEFVFDCKSSFSVDEADSWEKIYCTVCGNFLSNGSYFWRMCNGMIENGCWPVLPLIEW